jgi:predicted nicotinamide N-methyase
MPDVEGIFEDSLLSLFDHRPIAFSTAGPHEPYNYVPSLFRYAFDGSVLDFLDPPQEQDSKKHVEVYLPIAPSGLHTTLQLTHIWLSSILISDLIVCGVIPVKGERICELGAGAGLPGIVAARMGASAVISTDYAVPSSTTTSSDEGNADQPTDVLAVLRQNFRRALPGAQESTSWQVLGHTWGEPVDALLESCVPSPSHEPLASKFQTILLADLLWTTAAHADLITSLLRLLAPDGTAHVVAGLHQGRGAVERFRSAWIERGGWARDVMEVQWGQEGWEVLRDLRVGRESRRGEEGDDEHGIVVYFQIGLLDDP